MHTLRGDHLVEAQTRFKVLRNYFELTKELQTSPRSEDPYQKRSLLIPHVEKVIHNFLFDYFHNANGLFVPVDVKIQAPKRILTRSHKNALNNQLREYVSHETDVTALVKEYESQGFEVCIEETVGVAKVPIPLSHKTSNSHFLLSTAAHEAFHLYHRDTNAANYGSTVRETINISETAADLMGELFIDYIKNTCPNDEFRYNLLQEQTRYTEQVKLLQTLHVGIIPFLKASKTSEVRYQLQQFKKIHNISYTPMEFISASHYCGCIDTFDSLSILHGLSTSKRMFADISGLMCTKREVVDAVEVLEQFNTQPYEEIVPTIEQRISHLLQVKNDPSHFYSNDVRHHLAGLSMQFNGLMMKHQMDSIEGRNTVRTLVQKIHNCFPVNPQELNYQSSFKPTYSINAIINSVLYTLNKIEHESTP